MSLIKNPLVAPGAFLVGVVALGATAWAFLEMVEIGTCAQGGPFEISRPCPEGTNETVAILVGGIAVFVVALILLGLSNVAAAIAMFGLLFTVLGGCFILTELDDARFQGNMGGAGWICGPIFILLMGLPPIYAGFRLWLRGRRRSEQPSRLG